MGFNLDDIEREGVPIYFLSPGEVTVRIGPCSAASFSGSKIPLNGRHYVCAGKIILKNGKKLQANFEINTHTFDFLERDSVTVFVPSKRTWYYITDPILHEFFMLSENDINDYKWQPDIPLDYHEKGPYPMHWPK